MRTDRGYALITVMIMLAVLMIMLGALIVTIRGELSVTHGQHNRESALYLAEAGLAHAMAELEANPAWNGWGVPQTVPGVSGRYEVRFNQTAGPFTADDSINNVDGLHPHTYRGSNTLPAGHVLLVVRGSAGNMQRQVEAIVRQGGGLGSFQSPLVTSGRIRLAGNVTVNGFKNLTDPTQVNASVHSNLVDPNSNLVVFDDTSGGVASITGKVSSSGSDALAVNVSSATPGQGTANNAPQQSLPNIDILAMIAAKNGAPRPTLNPTGPNILGTGDYFVPASQSLDGDLVLNGSNLYVSGNLRINGSISGNGTVYVAGNTTFKGDARIATASPDKIALFSEGHIQLDGFDGTAWLNALTRSLPVGDPNRRAWGQSQEVLAEVATMMAQPNPPLIQGGPLDILRCELGGTGGATAPRPGRMLDAMGVVLNFVNSQPPSPTQAFMSARLKSLREPFLPRAVLGGLGLTDQDVIDSLALNRIGVCGMDVVIDSNETGQHSKLPLARTYVESIDYSRLGSSFFQGLLFSHGAIHASHDVTIVGAAVAKKTTNRPDLVVGTQTLKAGDIFLDNNSRLTYIEDFFKPRPGEPGPMTGFSTVLWMGR